MSGASIETTLEFWASSLRDVKARIRPLFTQERVASSVGLFLDGLLGDERRKTSWMRAEAAGDPGPWRQQAILGRGRWDADALRDVVRDYAADSVYGVGHVEMVLRRAGRFYELGVNSNHHFRSWQRTPPVAGTAEEIAGAIDPSRWQRLSAGDGTKGARLHDWVYCELADLDAAEYDDTRGGLWTRGLLIRRNIADGDLAFFSTWCPAGTGIEMLVKVEGHQWAIEDSFETAKNELGLDHNETRSWHGWHRHVSLVMLAFALMAVIRHRANTATPPKRMRRTTNTSRHR